MEIFSHIFKMVTPRALRLLLLFIALNCLTSATFIAALDKLWRTPMAWHGVVTGALFGVPSDILIWPHFHSQANVLLFWRGCVGGVSIC